MTTTTHHPEAVAEFAAAVREALSDLPPEELDEITDGLAADLAERAAESGDPDLGDPAAYAEELRAAAGYPPRGARSRRGAVLPDLTTLSQRVRTNWTELMEHPVAAAVAGFFVSLRPLWWVFRGWAIGMWIVSLVLGGWHPIPQSGMAWIVMLAVVVVSVQFGRGKWLPRRWMRRALLAVNVVMVVATPFVLGWAGSSYQNMQAVYDYGADQSFPQSLSANGMQIDNIFAYDENGEPIDRVQLFDQDGNPLNLVTNTQEPFWGTMNGQMVVPSGDVPGRAGWNVYPLQQSDWSSFEDDGIISESEIFESSFPSIHVKPLANRGPDTQEMSEGGPFASDEQVASPAPTPAP